MILNGVSLFDWPTVCGMAPQARINPRSMAVNSFVGLMVMANLVVLRIKAARTDVKG
jgi:hypothetical protein